MAKSQTKGPPVVIKLSSLSRKRLSGMMLPDAPLRSSFPRLGGARRLTHGRKRVPLWSRRRNRGPERTPDLWAKLKKWVHFMTFLGGEA